MWFAEVRWDWLNIKVIHAGFNLYPPTPYKARLGGAFVLLPPQRIRIPSDDKRTIMEKMSQVFDSGMMAYGPHVEDFERAFAKTAGTRYAVATGSCTQALEMAVRALCDPSKTTVLVPANTYMATPQAAIHAGKRVEFVDADRTLQMDADRMEAKMDDNRVGAVIVVHMGGIKNRSLSRIRSLCADAGVPLIEDAAHAHGCVYDGKSAGSIGAAGCFSFYPTKLMTVGGEGGMLTTDRKDVYEFARAFRHHGRQNKIVNHIQTPAYEHILHGHNYCMDEMRAIVGLTQLKRLPSFIRTRRRAAKIFSEKFNILPSGNYYKAVTLDNLQVTNKDVSLSGKIYPKPCHLYPEFASVRERFPVAEAVCRDHSCLPVYNDMSEAEANYVVDSIEVLCQ